MAAVRDGALGVLTTKGDLLGILTGGDVERLSVGADGQVLVADSPSTLGLKAIARIS